MFLEVWLGLVWLLVRLVKFGLANLLGWVKIGKIFMFLSFG